MTPSLANILDDLDIRVVNPAQHRPFTPMQTAAGATLERILSDHGEAHLRDVLTVLTESENTKHMLMAPVIKAVSGIMSKHPRWYENDASGFLAVMDKADLAEMYERSKANKGVVPAHATIATMLLKELGAAITAVKRSVDNVMHGLRDGEGLNDPMPELG